MEKIEMQKAFGKNLKHYRLTINKSQEDLALSEGISPTYIGALERGERCPSLETICKIARGLNISPVQLVDFETDKTHEAEAVAVFKTAIKDFPDKSKLKLARTFEKLAELYKSDCK
jgi:transcriptional regulator with XRE-family HTH domain